MPNRPVQRVNPSVEIYFKKINDLTLSNPDKELIKKAVLDQFVKKNEAIVLEEEERIPDD